MPRTRRVKHFGFIYHVMGKSIAEAPLFQDDLDKDVFLLKVKSAQKKHGFKLYGYCLMDNHVHLIVDANGADISKVMQRINQCYVQHYYNVKYKREGHLFKDRFNSKVVDNMNYLFTLSAYVHNNPRKIKGYENCPEKYKYSSFAYYLGIKRDTLGIIDREFITNFFAGNITRARRNYHKFVMMCNDDVMKAHCEFLDKKGDYRSGRTVLNRSFTPEDIMEFIKNYMNTDKVMLQWKYKREATKSRAICVFLIRYYCDFTYAQICSILGRLTLSRVSALADIGQRLMEEDPRYKNVLQDFLEFKAT